MAQQTKSASNRSAASTRKRLASTQRPFDLRKRNRGRARSRSLRRRNRIASKLKVPAIATGAAAAGLAGGLALAGRRSPRKLLGVRLPGSAAPTSQNLAEAAKQIGSFGERVGELATEIRTVRQGVANAKDQDQKRSPIEVVLQGLTARNRWSGRP